MDNLLRRSLAAPAPALAPNFDRRVLRAVRRDSHTLRRYAWMLFIGYGLVSALTSVVVMRGAGLHWLPIGAILAPLALLAAASTARRAKHGTARPQIAA